MSTTAAVVTNIRLYQEQGRNIPAPRPLSTKDAEDYVFCLNRSLNSLQSQVKEHEEALESLRGKVSAIVGNAPANEPIMRLRQTRALAAAYRSVTAEEPHLPSPESPLPALLAQRVTLRQIDESKAFIHELERDIETSRTSHEREKIYLEDASILATSLQQQVVDLEGERDALAQMTEQEIVENLLETKNYQLDHNRQQLKNIVRSFNHFVRKRLAIMIAAEDLGGPLVGADFDLSLEDLRRGFTDGADQTSSPSQAAVQRRKRIREVWGFEAAALDEDELDESKFAAKSFRELMQDLLNADAEGETTGTDSYIDIAPNTAAVRFLLQSLVAELDATNPRRLRLLKLGQS